MLQTAAPAQQKAALAVTGTGISMRMFEGVDKLLVAGCQTSALGQTCPSQTGPGSCHHEAWIRIQFHRVIEYIGLEGVFEGHLVQQIPSPHTPVLPSLIRDFALK